MSNERKPQISTRVVKILGTDYVVSKRRSKGSGLAWLFSVDGGLTWGMTNQEALWASEMRGTKPILSDTPAPVSTRTKATYMQNIMRD